MSRAKTSRPPKTFNDFSARFPRIAEAWQTLGEGGLEGPLDEKTARLIKLGISIASKTEGGTHSATRKALGAGATAEEIYQVVALAASTVGLPSTVAAFTWVEDELKGGSGPGKA